MTKRQEFLTKLSALAEMCGATLTPDIVGLYDQNLLSLGYEKLTEALNSLIINRKAQDRFPSIRDIRDLCEPGIHTIESASQELLQRTMEAVTRFGSYDPEGARAYMGEEAWAALPGYRGWEEYCMAGDTDLGGLPIAVARSQLRDRIKSRVTFAHPTGRVQLPPAGKVPFRAFVPHPQEQKIPIADTGKITAIGGTVLKVLEGGKPLKQGE